MVELYEPGTMRDKDESERDVKLDPYIGSNILEFQKFMTDPVSRKLNLKGEEFLEITKDLGTGYIKEKRDLKKIEEAWILFELLYRTGLHRAAAFIYSTYIQGRIQLQRSFGGFERQMANTNIKKQDVKMDSETKKRWGGKQD